MWPVLSASRADPRQAFNTCLAVTSSAVLLAAAYPSLGKPVQALVDLIGKPAVAAEAEPAPPQDAQPERLSERMQAALDYASRRYRVSATALEPVFKIVQTTARELRLDPLLILAVIAVESRFNPLSQSESGAQGLMQVIPRYHRNRLPPNAGKLSFFDPAINVRVGSQALYDFIRLGGGVTAGLQRFAGASNDPERSYATRVLAEKDRLESSVKRPRDSGERQAVS